MQANSTSADHDVPPTVGHEARACPIGRAGFLLGDRWVLLILRDATLGTTRFNDFRDGLGIADNILLDRLRRLVDAGVLVKVPYHDGRRTRQEYRLTQAGADLSPILRALGQWGSEHTSSAAPSEPMRAVHAECGGELSTDRVCTACGTRVDRDREAWIRPWRSATPQLLAAPVITSGEDAGAPPAAGLLDSEVLAKPSGRTSR